MILGDNMNIIVKSLISFGICFVVVLLIYVLFINRKRKEYTEGNGQVDIYYLVKKYRLDIRKTKYNTVKLIVAFINSFIIAFTFALIVNLKYKYVLKLLIAFVVMFILIYSLYEIVGRILKRRENKNSWLFDNVLIFFMLFFFYGGIMKRVKIFDEPHEKDLEDDINSFISGVDNIIDIQFRTAVSIFSEDQIYCFSAMIIYED